MSRKDRLKGIFDDTVEELAAANFRDEAPRGPAGPVRTMALTLGRMEEESKALQEAILSGEHVVDLDPDLIDVSFVRDRLSEGGLSLEDDFVRSIADNGQEVPILVREHPERKGRYQVAYGHRRLQAARLLGRPVRAVIRPLADTDVVIAQGIENSARQNLSYIERALFALTLEARGFERSVIMRALSTDKTELSKLISVARAVPDHVIRAIGNAPSVGRRRWIALSETLSPKHVARLELLFQRPDFIRASSDERFDMVVVNLAERKAVKTVSESWKPGRGARISASMKAGERSYTLAFKAEEAPDFGAFITGRLDELYREFKKINAGD
ncbi:plasmid partitioning protein RepB [Pararhizobium sp. O133]|uniref:plasmid partitioning protein RepB n=1 Tax=Pararhizobium sp. O133 TaxID=3449278 RepID=UPI003F6888F8